MAAGGLEAVTFDAAALWLGVTKLALICWFPSKVEFLSGFALTGLRDEARAIIGFHLLDLLRFRLMYLSPQIGATTAARQTTAELVTQIHSVTSEMYAAISSAMGEESDAREKVVALQIAAQVLAREIGHGVSGICVDGTDYGSATT